MDVREASMAGPKNKCGGVEEDLFFENKFLVVTTVQPCKYMEVMELWKLICSLYILV